MLSTITTEECRLIAQRLSEKVDLTNDLPALIFQEKNLDFWFFERSLLGDLELFEELLVKSHAQFTRGVGIIFSWASTHYKGRLLDGEAPGSSVLELKHQQFGGELALDLPNFYFDTNFEWLAYESSLEEWGVLAMDRSLANTQFAKFLNQEFMSIGDLWRISKSGDFNGALARAFLKNYSIN
ncbi:hypothetical protein ACIP01_10985 [Pseudomonas monteilii]|uniref:hypothetical protein n=1 Tax=Pseudomonas monteilii TaxID=76759 RepID=UPI00380028E8